VRQPASDRALYYRQLRETVHNVFAPELTSAHARDAVGLVERILGEFIVEEEWSDALSAEFGAELSALLGRADDGTVVSASRFAQLREEAAEVAGRSADDEGGRTLRAALADAERRFFESVEAHRAVTLGEDLEPAGASPSITRCSVNEAALSAYLRDKLPASPSLAVRSVELLPGGRSKETLLVSLDGTTELPPQVIVRKDRPVGLLQTRAADEFAVLAAVFGHGGVPVPEPFFAEEKDHGLGEGTFLVMARVPGAKAGEFFPDLAAPTEHRAEIARQLAGALAHLHSIPLDRLRHTGLDLHTSLTPDSLSGAVNGLVARIGELTGSPSVSVPLAHRWLLHHVDDVAPCARVCLLQQDFGFHNMLVEGDRVTALVDWEGATIGPPARELAAAYAPITALVDWDVFVQAYLAAGGPEEAVDERAVRYYRVFVALGGLMASRMGGHLFRTGAKRDLLTAHSGLDSYFRCQRNLARALHDAGVT